MIRAPKSKRDPNGAHVRLYNTILDSHAWLALDFSDRALYVELRRSLNGGNNGNIDATLSTLRHRGFKSPATISKGLRALSTVGLIAKTRHGGITAGAKFCSLYRFTDVPGLAHQKQGVEAKPATNEWRDFKALVEAERAIEIAHEAAKWSDEKKAQVKQQREAKNASKLQGLKRAATDSESMTPSFDSEDEQDTSASNQKLKPPVAPKLARKLAPALDFPAEWSLATQ